jgi:hypothetical protein
MWRSRKWIIAALLAAVILAGSIGGVVLAANNGDNGEAESASETLLDRVTKILVEDGVNITTEQLKDAFTQAQREMQTEALQNRLQALVEEGKIEQSEADAYLEWWLEKPDVPFGLGFHGPEGFGGMHGMRGFGGPCVPAE